MAESQQEDRSREDLTEEASPHKVEEYRKKGTVAQSKELTGLIALFATAVTLSMMMPKFGSLISEYMQEVFRTDLSARIDLGSQSVLRSHLIRLLKVCITIGIPIGFSGFIMGAIGSIIQVGSIFSFDPITPDFSKIDPLSGIKRFFSLKHLLDSLKLLFKVAVFLTVSFFLLKSEILQSYSYMGSQPEEVLAFYLKIGKHIFFTLLLVLALFAFLDFAFQKYEYGKSIRMTKQEAKQEHREREGDPHIKARIKSVQREMARRRMMKAVKKADVIITNPTHIAIAIMYDKDSMNAPRVVAKGADFIAQRIKQIAAENNVPLVENIQLARTLYKTVKLGHSIPKELYQAVAEVLAYVYKLRKRF